MSIKYSDLSCPNCGSKTVRSFFKTEQIPVHSVLLMDTKEEAVSYPKGDIELGFCENCTFVYNILFDPSKHEYSSKYEETQGFSETFNKFHANLAQKLIDKHNLHNKEIIEIGCGKGEFLTMICELGNNKGTGFDPAYVPGRSKSKIEDKINFVKDFYSEKYTDYHGDFVACKMTLEHIPDTLEFLKIVRRSIGERFNTIIFFQVPDVERILIEKGFWDIYYEHCSYFNDASLRTVFRLAGFKVIDSGKDYDDQYLMVEAVPTKEPQEISVDPVQKKRITDMLSDFESTIYPRLNEWRASIKQYVSEGKKVVLWGGGSKAVAFLTTLGIKDEIEFAVDINPFKHNTFLAGNGQKIVSPEFLKEYRPDIVIVMNPIYVEEITKDLNKMDIRPEVLPIDYFDKKG